MLLNYVNCMSVENLVENWSSWAFQIPNPVHGNKSLNGFIYIKNNKKSEQISHLFRYESPAFASSFNAHVFIT